MLEGKKIVLGVTGSVAAYKAVDLVSRLKKMKAEVRVIMTAAAEKFITPLSFELASGYPVHSELFAFSSACRVPHIDLVAGADLMIIAPATADFIGKAAHGLADDLLSSALLAATCPIMFCPAMNVNMYKNVFVQKNLLELKNAGHLIVEPEVGKLACGTEGKGRLPETKTILWHILNTIPLTGDFSGLTVLVTAGGTREAIDPVRYVSNRSSGKMGYALAEAACQRGAKSILISGPSNLSVPPGVEIIRVETAQEMYEAVMNKYNAVDVIIKAAAVADYRPKDPKEHKIKKSGDTFNLEMEKNIDILYELGANKLEGLTLVGFAAETDDLVENAWQKIKNKNLDLMIANDIKIPGAGFGSDDNLVKIIYPDGEVKSLELMNKRILADCILDEIIKIRQGD